MRSLITPAGWRGGSLVEEKRRQGTECHRHNSFKHVEVNGLEEAFAKFDWHVIKNQGPA